MLFLLLGIALLGMKYLEVGPVATLSWIWVFTPFGLAVAWWAWADASGYTKRKAMESENARRDERIRKNKENIGTLNSGKKR